eukprot:3202880-Karenia_brevis.AAC.1
MKSISIAYLRGLRAATHKTFHDMPESPDEEVLVAAKAQPAEMRIAFARLRFFVEAAHLCGRSNSSSGRCLQ